MSYPNDHPCRDCDMGWQSANVNGKYQGCHDSCEKLKVWQEAHPKPISEWTLAEVKQWCSKYSGKATWPCENSGCMLRERGICNKEWVHEWDLEEKPRFTEEEVAFMKTFQAACNNEVGFRRDNSGVLFWTSGGRTETWLPNRLFPAIRAGQAVKLKDIIGNEQEDET